MPLLETKRQMGWCFTCCLYWAGGPTESTRGFPVTGWDGANVVETTESGVCSTRHFWSFHWPQCLKLLPSLKLTARPWKNASFLVNTIKMVDFHGLCGCVSFMEVNNFKTVLKTAGFFRRLRLDDAGFFGELAAFFFSEKIHDLPTSWESNHSKRIIFQLPTHYF